MEPSTSVRRNVTVPVGNARIAGCWLMGRPYCLLIRSASVASIDIAASGRSRRIDFTASPLMTNPRTLGLGDHGRGAWPLAQDRQLPDVVARLVVADEPFAAIRIRAHDPDGAGDDHDELLREVALAHEDLARCVGPLHARRGDPLQVLRVETLEQGDAAEEEHRVEVGQRPFRARHVRSSVFVVDASPCERSDPRVRIIRHPTQGAVAGTACRAADGGFALEQRDEGRGDAPVGDRIERLEGLGPDLDVVRAQAAADDSPRLGRAEGSQRCEGEVLQRPLSRCQDGIQKGRYRRSGGVAVAVSTGVDRDPRVPEQGGTLQALHQPCRDGRVHGRIALGDAGEGDEGCALCRRSASAEHVDQVVAIDNRGAQHRGRGFAHRAGLVLERRAGGPPGRPGRPASRAP